MAEGEERWTLKHDNGHWKISGPFTDGEVVVVRASRFEEVQRQYEELEGDYALRLSHLMAEEEHAKALAADLERAQEVLREFVDWFDERFPRDGSGPLPGVDIWAIFKKAEAFVAEARERGEDG